MLQKSVYKIPLTIPAGRYTSLDAIIDALNLSASVAKHLRYKVTFSVSEVGVVGMQLLLPDGTLEAPHPDTFKVADFGPYRQTDAIGLEWHKSSKLALLLGLQDVDYFTRNIPKPANHEDDVIVQLGGTRPAPVTQLKEVPFIHVSLRDYTDTQWMVQLPGSISLESTTSYAQTFLDDDEGIVRVTTDTTEINHMVRHDAIHCDVHFEYPYLAPNAHHTPVLAVQPHGTIFFRVKLVSEKP